MYYKLLLASADLTFMREWPKDDILKCSQRAPAQKRVRRWGLQRVPQPGLAEIEDEAVPALAVADGEPEPAPPLRFPERLAPEPVPSRVHNAGDGVVVDFDNYTHASVYGLLSSAGQKGTRSAAAMCEVKNYPNRARAVAWLLAWRGGAERFDNADEHINHNPPEAVVSAYMWAQIHGSWVD